MVLPNMTGDPSTLPDSHGLASLLALRFVRSQPGPALASSGCSAPVGVVRDSHALGRCVYGAHLVTQDRPEIY